MMTQIEMETVELGGGAQGREEEGRGGVWLDSYFIHHQSHAHSDALESPGSSEVKNNLFVVAGA